MKGIDVSEHNGIINWEKVKSQIDFAIIRVSYGQHKVDKMAKRNIEECIRLNIPFGVYLYSYALNVLQAENEAKLLINTIAPYKENISYPVIIDMEDADGYKAKNGNPSNETLVNICEEECNIFASNEYFPMIYASKSWFDTKLKSDKLNGFSKWLAWWYEKADFNKSIYPLWQYKSNGKIDGISGNVDMNESFVDFPSSIKFLKKILTLQKIGLLTGLSDKTLQYFDSYRFNEELIRKIYDRLQKPKIKDKIGFDKWKIIQIEFNLDDNTIHFMKYYLYADGLRDKLFASIVEL